MLLRISSYEIINGQPTISVAEWIAENLLIKMFDILTNLELRNN